MSEIKYGFGGIESAADDLDQLYTRTEGLIAQGNDRLKTLSALWGGESSDAYHKLHATWEEAHTELNKAFQGLAHTIRGASQAMLKTENAVTNMFT